MAGDAGSPVRAMRSATHDANLWAGILAFVSVPVPEVLTFLRSVADDLCINRRMCRRNTLVGPFAEYGQKPWRGDWAHPPLGLPPFRAEGTGQRQEARRRFLKSLIRFLPIAHRPRGPFDPESELDGAALHLPHPSPTPGEEGVWWWAHVAWRRGTGAQQGANPSPAQPEEHAELEALRIGHHIGEDHDGPFRAPEHQLNGRRDAQPTACGFAPGSHRGPVTSVCRALHGPRGGVV
jgi:hypothetical protein